ncbi:hypothetical protein BDY24DRAFT_149925 [Mrakia frigida]|uniref:uncharacterized protein n=1 Tax=Mrakia frigida TaxID=29902 RepID=UPI003FCBFB94
MIPTSSRAHYNYGPNPYWHQPYPQSQPHFQAAPPPPPAAAPIYVDAGGRGFRAGRGGHPRRIVWFTIGSLATLWWMKKTSECEGRGPGSFGFCASRSLALPSPPEVVETKEADSRGGGGGGFGGWRRKREDEEMKRREEKRLTEEKWRVDAEKLSKVAEEARENVRDFAATRLDEMLAALTELKKELKPSPPPPAKPADVRLV